MLANMEMILIGLKLVTEAASYSLKGLKNLEF